MMRTKLVKLITLLIISSSVAWAQTDTVKQLDLKYGKFDRNTLDLYLPPKVSPKTPFIILIHGGAWVQAGKEYVRDFQEYLLKQGIASVNVNHRYANNTSVHYKEILADIDAATNYCIANADKWNTRKDGFSTAGFSSGAHLALLYGYTSTKKINAIVDFSGPNNFTDTATLNYCVKYNLINLIEKITGDPFTNVDNVPKSFALASPITYAKSIPTFIAHGVIDEVVVIRQSQMLVDKLKQLNANVKFIKVDSLAHNLDKYPKVKLKLYKASVQWLKKYS